MTTYWTNNDPQMSLKARIFTGSNMPSLTCTRLHVKTINSNMNNNSKTSQQWVERMRAINDSWIPSMVWYSSQQSPCSGPTMIRKCLQWHDSSMVRKCHQGHSRIKNFVHKHWWAPSVVQQAPSVARADEWTDASHIYGCAPSMVNQVRSAINGTYHQWFQGVIDDTRVDADQRIKTADSENRIGVPLRQLRSGYWQWVFGVDELNLKAKIQTEIKQSMGRNWASLKSSIEVQQWIKSKIKRRATCISGLPQTPHEFAKRAAHRQCDARSKAKTDKNHQWFNDD